ncbi:MAG: hypothetical protein J3R72DRAFT_512993 [Linnemannia gamsii]|nr:MAG: hypothetical protein J3R72DRAFT_512993 [Linnemannia gamsii]
MTAVALAPAPVAVGTSTHVFGGEEIISKDRKKALKRLDWYIALIDISRRKSHEIEARNISRCEFCSDEPINKSPKMSSSIRKIVLLVIIVASLTPLCLTSTHILAAPVRPNMADVSAVTGGSSTLEKRYPPCAQDHCLTTCINIKDKSDSFHVHVCVCTD